MKNTAFSPWYHLILTKNNSVVFSVFTILLGRGNFAPFLCSLHFCKIRQRICKNTTFYDFEVFYIYFRKNHFPRYLVARFYNDAPASDKVRTISHNVYKSCVHRNEKSYVACMIRLFSSRFKTLIQPCENEATSTLRQQSGIAFSDFQRLYGMI